MNPTLCRTVFAAACLALSGCAELVYGEMEEPTLVLTQRSARTFPPGRRSRVTVPQGLLTFTFNVPDIPPFRSSTKSMQAGFTIAAE